MSFRCSSGRSTVPRSRLSVFEKLPNQSSLEEAISGVPHLTSEVNTTSFLYPAGGVRPLEPGKTYVWFVEGIYGNTGGPGNTVKSQLRSFTVSAGGIQSGSGESAGRS